MAHFLFCVSLGGGQRHSVELGFLYTLCHCVWLRPNFGEDAKWDFTPGLEEGKDNKMDLLPSRQPVPTLPFTREDSHVTNIFYFNGIKLWFAEKVNQISTAVILACVPKNSQQLSRQSGDEDLPPAPPDSSSGEGHLPAPGRLAITLHICDGALRSLQLSDRDQELIRRRPCSWIRKNSAQLQRPVRKSHAGKRQKEAGRGRGAPGAAEAESPLAGAQSRWPGPQEQLRHGQMPVLGPLLPCPLDGTCITGFREVMQGT